MICRSLFYVRNLAFSVALVLGAEFGWSTTVLAAGSPAQWEKDIAAFEASDKTNPPPKRAILFIGSSSIRMWKTLSDDFKGFAVINRGFGGSQMSDSDYYADRIVLPYQPRQILVYAGDNDLAAGKSPEQILADVQRFVETVHRSLPEARISYIAIKPSPSRWKLADRMRTANRLIAEFTRSDKRLDFVDVFTPMLDEAGQPKADLFLSDNLHMNSKGYQLWRSRVLPFLRRNAE
jgi:lysophospholipase L1-like esterase